MKGVVWKSKLSGSRLTDERPAGVESYKKPLCSDVFPSVGTVQEMEMSVQTGAAEGELVSLEIAEQHPKDKPSQLPASLTSVCSWLRKQLVVVLKCAWLGDSPGAQLWVQFHFLCILSLISRALSQEAFLSPTPKLLPC